MSQLDVKFSGSIPAIYEQYLGPLIFQPYALDIAGRLAGLKRGALLEIAAGTGIVTRTLAQALPASVAIVASDLNQPMLDFAAAHAGQTRPVKWQQADALNLPFPDVDFDVVVCQFGAMFFPDKVAAYREVRRVLKSGGRFIFNVWDRIEDNEAALAVNEAVASAFPQNPPKFIERTPHGYFDEQRILADVEQAGFATINIDTVQLRSCAPSHRDPAIGFCQGTPLRNEIEARDPGRLEPVTDLAAAMVKARLGAGPIDGRMQAHVITALK